MDTNRLALLWDEIRAQTAVMAVQAAVARDQAAADDPMGLVYSLKRLSAYLRSVDGLITDMRDLSTEQKQPEPVGDDW